MVTQGKMGSGPEPHGHPLVDLRDHLGQVVGCVNHEVGAALNSEDFNGSFYRYNVYRFKDILKIVKNQCIFCFRKLMKSVICLQFFDFGYI